MNFAVLPLAAALLAATTWIALAAAGGAFLLAGVGRRWLPQGMAVGLFAGGVTTLLALFNLGGEGSAPLPLRVTILLTALAVLWYFVGRWVERDRFQDSDRVQVDERSRRARSGGKRTQATAPQESEKRAKRGGAHAAGRRTTEQPPAAEAPPPEALERNFRAHFAGLVAAAAGCAAIGAALAYAPAANLRERLTISAILVLLFALTLRRFTAQRHDETQWGLVGLLGTLLWLWLAPLFERWPASADYLGHALWSFALLSLILALAPPLGRWRHRRRIWRLEPQRLADPPPAESTPHIVALILGAAAVVAAPFAGIHWFTPLAALFAAVAAFVVFHLNRQQRLAAQLGLLLLFAGLVLAANNWLPGGAGRLLLGVALAGAYLLWLSEFWKQQLREGVAWTTTGYLIPQARTLGITAGPAAGVVALWTALTWPSAAPRAPGIVTLCAALPFALLLGALLVRQARVQSRSLLVLAAAAAWFAAAVPLRLILQRTGWTPDWPLLLALLALLLTLRTLGRSHTPIVRMTWNALLGGVLPVMIVAGLSVGMPDRHIIELTATFALVGGALALLIKFERRQTAAAPAPAGLP